MTTESIDDYLNDTEYVSQTPPAQVARPPALVNDAFWPTAIAVTVVSGLVYLACMGIAKGGGELFGIFIGAQVVGQLAVVGMWLAMGKTPLAGRLPAAAGAVVLFAAPMLVILNAPEAFLEALLPMMLFVSAAALTTFVLHLAGGRVVFRTSGATHDPAVNLAPRQFSLREIFALTTSVAVVLGLSRFSGLRAEFALPILLAGSVVLAITLSAAWAVLGESVIAWALALVGAPLIGLIVAQFTGPRSVWPIELGTVLLLGVVVFTLLPFRLLGYRMRFRADRVETPRQPALSVETPEIVAEPASPEGS